MAEDAPGIKGVVARAYVVPTDAPGADGTIEWDSTTIVIAEAGGERGVGYSYASRGAVCVIEDLLAPQLVGGCAFDAPRHWQATLRAVRNAAARRRSDPRRHVSTGRRPRAEASRRRIFRRLSAPEEAVMPSSTRPPAFRAGRVRRQSRTGRIRSAFIRTWIASASTSPRLLGAAAAWRARSGLSAACRRCRPGTADRALRPALDRTGEDALVIADGFSCREQIRRFSRRRPLHVAEVADRRFGGGLNT
jgi:hypothetical protein